MPEWERRPDPTGLACAEGGAVRASDHEPQQVDRILSAAAGEGLLTPTEADERLAALHASRFRAELTPLTADLPHGGRHLLENTAEARSAIARSLSRSRGGGSPSRRST